MSFQAASASCFIIKTEKQVISLDFLEIKIVCSKIYTFLTVKDPFNATTISFFNREDYLYTNKIKNKSLQ